MFNTTKDPIERFWQLCSYTASTQDCWEWNGYVSAAGYGRFNSPSGSKFAHRWIYEQFWGPIGSQVVRHTCGNSKCCNIFHLMDGTAADNNADRVRDGTWRGRAPEDAPKGYRCAPRGAGPFHEAHVARFFRFVAKTESCWLWTGALNKGYPVFSAGKYRSGHRWSYANAYGDFDDYLFVLHTCDNPQCVRPEHLHLGTALENAQEVVSRGRGNRPTGESAPTSKLTAKQVREARELYALCTVGQEELAKVHGVCGPTVSAFIRGETWVDAGGPTFKANPNNAALAPSSVLQLEQALVGGGSVKELAEQFGVGRHVVQRVLEKLRTQGFQYRNRRGRKKVKAG